MKIVEHFLEHKRPIVSFIGGSSVGVCIGFSIHEYLHNHEEWKKIVGDTKRKIISNRTTQKSYARTDLDVVKEKNDHSEAKKVSKTNEKLENTYKDREAVSKTENPRKIRSGIEKIEKQKDTSKPQIGNTGKSNNEDDKMEEVDVEVKTQTRKDSKAHKSIEEKDGESISKVMKVSKTKKASKTNQKLENTYKDRKAVSETENPITIGSGLEKIEKQKDASKPQIRNTGKSNNEDDKMEEIDVEVKTQTRKDSKANENIEEKDGESISKVMNKKVSKAIKKKGKSKKVASKIEKDSVQEDQRHFLRSSVQEQQIVDKKESEVDENSNDSN